MRTLYDVLGVTPSSSPSEIRRAYRRAAMRWHPDRHAGHVEDATRRFKEIGHAYRVLSNASRRATYDEALNAERERLRGQGGAYEPRDPRERIRPDDSTATILVACAWRTLHAVDRATDNAIAFVARALRRLRRRRGVSAARAIATLGIALAIVALILALPGQRAQTLGASGTFSVIPEPSPVAPERSLRRGNGVRDVFPNYDPASRSARFTLSALPASRVYDPLRPLEGHAMIASLMLRDDLGAAYRMYYFRIAPASAADECTACNAFFARFMTRRQADGESVVVPMQLVYMPERATREPSEAEAGDAVSD